MKRREQDTCDLWVVVAIYMSQILNNNISNNPFGAELSSFSSLKQWEMLSSKSAWVSFSPFVKFSVLTFDIFYKIWHIGYECDRSLFTTILSGIINAWIVLELVHFLPDWFSTLFKCVSLYWWRTVLYT